MPWRDEIDSMTVDELRHLPLKRLRRKLEQIYANRDYYKISEAVEAALLLRIVDLLSEREPECRTRSPRR